MRILMLSSLLLLTGIVIANWEPIKTHYASFHTWVRDGGTTGLIVWAAACGGLVALVSLALSLL